MHQQHPAWKLAAIAGGALAMAAFAAPGCEEQGPAERTGEAIDESVDEAGEAVEDAADDLKDATDN